MQPRRRTAGGTDSNNAVDDPEGLLVRCAWCGRYSLGSEWLEEDDLPSASGAGRKLQEEQVTHSICPDCSELRY